MIEISAVSKSYNGGKTYSVDNLSLTIKSGEIFGLLGPNGAGKSTLLNMLSGILKPDRGTIKIEGIDIVRQPLEAKRRLAFMGDSPDHLLRLKGYEFLQFIADVYGVPQEERVERIDALAKQYAMDHELNNQLQSYSHGMRQKMMVMGALLPNPDVWLLDEPMTGLDPRASWILKQSMREHANAGKTVLFSTHVLDVAEKVVDRVGIINKGKLIFVGTVDEMRAHFQQNGSLEEMFLELTSDASPLSASSAQSGEASQEPSLSSASSTSAPSSNSSDSRLSSRDASAVNAPVSNVENA